MAAEKTLEVLFERALTHPSEMRPTYLNEACPHDEALRGELTSLLEAYETAPSYFAYLAVGVKVLLTFPPPALTQSAYRYLLQHTPQPSAYLRDQVRHDG